MPQDKNYWAVGYTGPTRTNDGVYYPRRTRTECMKAFCGPEEGYQKRWRRVKAWETKPRIVRVTISW